MSNAKFEWWVELQSRIAMRVNTGQTHVVESLLAETPGLRSDPQLLVDCIYAEYCRRVDRGESPERDEYFRRFPGYAERFLHLPLT